MVSPWLAGAIGWAFFGPLGGLFGYAAGSLYNAVQRASRQQAPSEEAAAAAAGARYGFLTSLLALTAAMMKADGRATQSELEVVKQFLRQQLGLEIAREALPLLREALQQDIPLQPVCEQIRQHMNYSQRLALLHYLYSIARADGRIHPAEERLLAHLAAEFGLSEADIRSIAAMFAPEDNLAADYRILEISPDASDDEVRRAYRRMSMKHHPDKVAHLGPEFQKTATQKFQRVNAAYANIKKARGMA